MRITLIIYPALLFLGCGHTTPSGPVESTSPSKSESVDIPTAEATTTANDEVLDGGSDGEVEDGGTVKNVDGDKVGAYFNALDNVQSVEEERKLLTEFADHNAYARWINEYNEKHFDVFSFIYHNPGCTNAEIWRGTGGKPARDDSADADLFKMLMHDFAVGHLVRQYRDTNGQGQFIKKSQKGVRKAPASPYMKSPFANEEPHYLTQLGEDFVRYV